MRTVDVPTNGWMIFSEWSVQRLLCRAKFQTRRLPKRTERGKGRGYGASAYQPGDVLYVREPVWRDSRDDRISIYGATPEWHIYNEPAPVAVKPFVPYRSDNRVLDGTVPTREECLRAVTTNRFWKRYPAMRCPRWCSRLFIRVTEVRVEPLQAITLNDIVAEGRALSEHYEEGHASEFLLRLWREGWNDLHPGEGDRWEDNPEVIAYTFEYLEEVSQRLRPELAIAA